MRRFKVSAKRPQASQLGYDGRTIYRWYVWISDRKRPTVTWAVTADEAAQKRLGVWKVEPAPHEI